MDDTVYSDPHVFRPERFLPPNPEPLPTDFFFGFGRRYVFSDASEPPVSIYSQSLPW